MYQLSQPGSVAGSPLERAQSPEALFAAVRADDGARPLVTFYDDSTGERMELSAISLGNWVAKTHFLLIDELGLGPGDRAFVDVPLHWQRLVVWFGAWSAGLEVVTSADSADVAFVGPHVQAVATGIDDVFALALQPWGRGFDGAPPAGTHDFVAAVRPQPDAWGSVRSPGGPDDGALDGIGRRALVTSARALATELGLGAGSRVRLDETSAYADRVEAVLAVLAVGGSMVLVRAPSGEAAAEARRDQQEQITHRL